MGCCIESKLSENDNSIPLHTLKKELSPSPFRGGGGNCKGKIAFFKTCYTQYRFLGLRIQKIWSKLQNKPPDTP